MDTSDFFDNALRQLALARDCYEVHDYLGACRHVGATMNALRETAMPLVQGAYDQGATKKAIALALDMPPSYLRGLEKTRA